MSIMGVNVIAGDGVPQKTILGKTQVFEKWVPKNDKKCEKT